MSIHPTAIVAPGAQIHETAEIGPYAIIGKDVKIGAGTTVGSHTVIEGDTTIGQKNRIFHHASIGAPPQDLKFHGEHTRLVIGDENQIREFTTLHLGTEGGGGLTRIGNKNLFMAYAHVAHDCIVGNGNVFANSATLAGHVEIGDFCTIGGLAAVHQFTRIGKHAFLAGGTMAVMDVPPYCIAQGDRAELAGPNAVGLKRHGYTDEQQARIKDAYRLLFRSKMGLNEAISQLQAEMGQHSEIALLLEFVTTSKRGITR
ncbi:MAG: acyl-ACP--UDP-N-acetylglucosamine O-acyltransferase [Archangium sp.]|nr:acyl-ACP--UDP-N-acetylglucosamine O-acyltransferase [Archangium sp.]